MRVKLPRRLLVFLFIAGGAGTTPAAPIAAVAADHGDAQLASKRLRHECPDGLTGAWHGILPVELLVDMRLAITKRMDGEIVAEISTQAGTEEVRAWMDGPHLRFQSGTLPVAFRGEISGDGRTLDGFIQQGPSIVRVSLQSVPFN